MAERTNIVDVMNPGEVAAFGQLNRSDKGNPTEELLKELAHLSPIEYDQQRDSAAKNLGVRISTLDSQVESRRPQKHPEQDGDGSIVLEMAERWQDAVDGAELLTLLMAIIRRFTILPAGGDVVITLFVLHTYTFDAADASPILALTSAEKRCGKTVVLEILQTLVSKPLPASNITAAALFRTVEAFKPTLLIDEADSFLRDNEELRGVLNSGHRKATATIIRTTGDAHEPKTFSTWCPKAIAAIGKLPGTLEDRSIVIKMLRKARGERVERLRHGQLTLETANIRRKAARWGQDQIKTLKWADPPVPEQLNDRAADCWRPLLAIADLAGGEWPARAREAATLLSGCGEDPSTGVQLLADIEVIFRQHQIDGKLASETIVEELEKLEDRPWPEWKNSKPMSKNQLARQLDRFDIKPKKVRLGTTTAQGYIWEQFADAFARYLPIQNGTLEQSTTGAGFSDSSKENTKQDVPFQKCHNSPDVNDVPDVPFQQGAFEGEERL